MSGRIVFHLGLHKTATTALQRHFFPAVEGIHYLGRQFPADPTRAIDRVIDAVATEDPAYFDAPAIGGLLDECCRDGAINLVSHELLSGPLWSGLGQRGLDHRSAIIRNLAALRPDAQVLLVLRRQDEWARSVYRQYVVAGGVEKPDTVFVGERPLFSPHRFLYAPYVRALRDAFPGRVGVLFYEQLMEDRSAFFRAMGQFIGVALPDRALPSSNSSQVGPGGMALSRLLNRFFRGRINSSAPIPGIPRRDRGRWRRESAVALLHKLWPKLSGPAKAPGSQRLPAGRDADLYGELLARCGDDNHALANLLGIDLAPYGYY